MTWNAAFPSSPLSRSALRGDTGISAFSTKSHSSSDHSSNGSDNANSSNANSSRLKSNHPSNVSHSEETFTEEALGSNFRSDAADPDGEFLRDPMPEWENQSSNLDGLGVREAGILLPSYRPSGLSNTAPRSVSRSSPKTPSRSQSSPSPSPRSNPSQSNSTQLRQRRSSGRQMSSPVLGGSPIPPSNSPLRHGLSPSPSPSPSQSLMHSHSLLGSYEESLFSGRMASAPSAPLFFDAQLGVLGVGKCPANLKCPPHLNLKFPARFYGGSSSNLNAFGEAQGRGGFATSTGLEGGLGSPYVGTVDLESHYWDQMLAVHTSLVESDLETRNLQSLSVAGRETFGDSSLSSPSPPRSQSNLPTAAPSFPGYRIPPKGQIQLVIKNPNFTAVKLFLVPYDLTDMPSGTKTFIRQKCLASPPVSNETLSASSSPIGSKSPNTRATRETLRYAIHLQFCAVASPSNGSKSKGERKETDLESSESRTTRRTRASLPDSSPNSVKKELSSMKPSPRIYLHRDIRVVFAPRAPDKEERLTIVTEMPGKPSVSQPVSGSAAMGGIGSKNSGKVEKAGEGQTRLPSETRDGMYASYSGPGEDWILARKEAKEKSRTRERRDRSRAARLSETCKQTETDPSSNAIPTPVAPEAPEEDRLQEGFFSSSVLVNSDPNGERWEGGRSEIDEVESYQPGSSAQDERATLGSLHSNDVAKEESHMSTLTPQSTPSSLPIDQQISSKVGRQSFSLSPSSSRNTSQGYFNSRLPQSARITASSGVAAEQPGSEADQALLDAWHHRLHNQASQRSHSPSSRPLSPGGSTTSFAISQSQTPQIQSFSQAFNQSDVSRSRPDSPSSRSRSRGSSSASRSGFHQASRPTSPLAHYQPPSLISSSSFNQSPTLSPVQHPLSSVPMSPHLLPTSRSRTSSLSLTTTTQVSDTTANGQIAPPGLSEIGNDSVHSQVLPRRPSLMRRISSQSSNGSLNSSLKDSVSSLKGLKLE